MPLYEYKCRECGTPTTLASRVENPDLPCRTCGEITRHRRVFGFALKPMMHEHYNKAVGKPISDMHRFEAELRKKSDLASEHTGIEHRFVPVEYGDAAAVGATNEGIDESNRIRSMRGEPLLPEIK